MMIMITSSPPDVVYASTGDQLWWSWDGEAVDAVKETLLLLEEDKILNPAAKKPENEEFDDSQLFILITYFGLKTYITFGVFHS